jgi:UDP-3-O-[3-hydroxymyristoyl] glucosamine N-acyltransferase
MNIQEIAKILQIDFKGNNFEVTGLNTLADATNCEISFVSSSKYINEIKHTKAGAIIVDEKNKDFISDSNIALVVESPYWSMAELSKYFAPSVEDSTMPLAVVGEGSVVSKKAEIANGAIIGKNCTILAGVYVGSNAKVGDNTILYPNVVVYRDCIIGSNCIIHANTTIGCDGFGFATNKKGVHKKIYQNGNVVIGNDVEIGSSTAIDRAVFSSTIIKDGVHIDNLVHIGHNCIVGEHSVFAAQSGVAGSSKFGRNVVMGGQCGIAGHLDIASFSTFAAKSGVSKSIKDSGKTFAGFPFMEHKTWLKLQAKIAKLLK